MKIARDNAEQEASSLRQALREYDEAAVEVLNVCAKGTAGSGTPQSEAFGKLDTAWFRARPLLENGVKPLRRGREARAVGVKVSVNVGDGVASNVILAFDGGDATSLTLDEAEQLGKTLEKAVRLAKKGL